MTLTTWWLALALMLFCEGVLIGIAPATWRRIIRNMTELPDSTLRHIGTSMALAALLIVTVLLWYSR